MRAPGERRAGVVAARPAIAGGSAEADADAEALAAGERVAMSGRRLIQPEVIGLAVLCAAASVFFGIYPSPLLDLADHAAAALTNLF
jgi:NADH-quinone oxidoreductase subunit N